ncbi:MAG: hypothetical protein K6B71_01505 [Alphaproteobacteria bacterium]|nr:hypothetical protein [Alphaproteobacteria bacterium]
MASIKSVLTDFFKQYHFNKMAPNVRARFDDYRNSGNKKDLTDDMHDWVRDHIDEVTGENKELPDIASKLTDDQIVDLYTEMNSIVAEMADDKKRFNNYYGTIITDFLDEYYGQDKTFFMPELSGSAKSALIGSGNKDAKDSLADVIEKAGLQSSISNFLKQNSEFKDKGYTYDTFISNLKEGKYDKDPEYRNLLKLFFESYQINQYTYDPVKQAAYNEFQNIQETFNNSETQIKYEYKERFKRDLPDILKKIHDNKKFREFYEAHDNGNVSAALNKAKDKVSYDKEDSQNFIHPKAEDELTVIQKIQKNVSDKFEDYFGKYVHLRGDQTFNKAEPLAIFKAMDKLKIKPTEGLGAIIDKADAIKEKMEHKSISADDHLDWFVSEMKKIKTMMPKAFDNALQNGWQLNAIAQQVIKDGVPLKVEQAKTTLELLAVMQYGHSNSKIMDAIKEDKELFTLFSNPELSWNKGPGKEVIGVVTKATDKLIRFGALAVGYSLTAAINEIRKIGTKIKKEKGQLAAVHPTKKAQMDQGKVDAHGKLDAARQEKTDLEAQHHADFAGYGDFDDPQKTLKNKQRGLDTRIKHINSLLEDLATEVESSPFLTPEHKEIINNFREQTKAFITGQSDDIPDLGMFTGQNSGIAQKVKNIRTKLLDFKKVRDKKAAFENAIADIELAKENEARYQKEIDDWDDDHKDKYEELKDYWNKLIGNRYSPRGLWNRFKPGSRKNKQAEALGYMERAA